MRQHYCRPQLLQTYSTGATGMLLGSFMSLILKTFTCGCVFSCSHQQRGLLWYHYCPKPFFYLCNFKPICNQSIYPFLMSPMTFIQMILPSIFLDFSYLPRNSHKNLAFFFFYQDHGVCKHFLQPLYLTTIYMWMTPKFCLQLFPNSDRHI